MKYWVFLLGNEMFLLTLFLFGFSFLLGYTRRDRFRLRVFLSCTAAILLTAAESCLYAYLSNRFGTGGISFKLISLADYLLLFVFALAVFAACFSESRWDILFGGVAAYACQHITSNIILVLRAALGLDTLITSGSASLQLLYYLPAVVVPLLLYAVLYYPLVRRAKAQFVRAEAHMRIFWFSVGTLAVVLLLNLFRDIYGGESVRLNVLCGCFSIFCCLFILLLYAGMLSNNFFRKEIDTIQDLWEKDRKQYELTRENIDAINVKCHDLRKQFELFQGYGKIAGDSEMEKLKEAISIYDSMLKTGNKTLDTLLAEYMLYCERHNIRFTCVADGGKLSFMRAEDIYSFFSNAISNAVEAVAEADDPSNRVIALSVKEKMGMVSVRVENYSPPKEGEEWLRTKKKDRHLHGYGIRSMQIIAEKYGGQIDFRRDGEIFVLAALFPAQSEG